MVAIRSIFQYGRKYWSRLRSRNLPAMRTLVSLLVLNLIFITSSLPVVAADVIEEPVGRATLVRTDWTVTVSLPKGEIVLGQKLSIAITLKNVTDANRWVSDWHPIRDYAIELVNGADQKVPMQERFQPDGLPLINSFQTFLVPSGKAREYEVDLNVLLQIKEPGDYVLRVGRRLSPADSNIAALMMDPPKAALIEAKPLILHITK